MSLRPIIARYRSSNFVKVTVPAEWSGLLLNSSCGDFTFMGTVSINSHQYSLTRSHIFRLTETTGRKLKNDLVVGFLRVRGNVCGRTGGGYNDFRVQMFNWHEQLTLLATGFDVQMRLLEVTARMYRAAGRNEGMMDSLYLFKAAEIA
eukprot:g1532.t1